MPMFVVTKNKKIKSLIFKMLDFFRESFETATWSFQVCAHFYVLTF